MEINERIEAILMGLMQKYPGLQIDMFSDIIDSHPEAVKDVSRFAYELLKENKIIRRGQNRKTDIDRLYAIAALAIIAAYYNSLIIKTLHGEGEGGGQA